MVDGHNKTKETEETEETAETLYDQGVEATLPAQGSGRSKDRGRPQGRGSKAKDNKDSERATEQSSVSNASILERQKDSDRDVANETADLAELPSVDPSMYVFGRWFARGGMGRIAEVRDRRLGRVVAIKELTHPTDALIDRFTREAYITARLQHPAIVSVHEAGRWPDGNPFFAMRLVEGQSLKERLEITLDIEDRLGLLSRLITVANALGYAHEKGVVHRDLKPANILLGAHGETVVIDWGLAKDLSDKSDEFDPLDSLISSGDTSMTVAGSVMGTPGYMAPEQARGEPADARSDVYAIGAILYEVLSGAAPFTGDTSASVVEQVVEGPPPPIGDRVPDLAKDLETIISTAMARDPQARYASAVELAADLRAFQTGRLVTAHRYSRGQLVRRWFARHRTAVMVGAAAIAVLMALSVVSVSRIVSERDAARMAQASARSAQINAQERADGLVVAQARALVNKDPVQALELVDSLAEGSHAWASARGVVAEAARLGFPSFTQFTKVSSDLSLALPDGDWLVLVENEEIRLLERGTPAARALAGKVVSIDIDSDGRLLAVSGVDGDLSVWALPGLERLFQFKSAHRGFVQQMSFNPTGDRLVTVGLDERTKIWNLETGSLEVEYRGILRGVEFSPDGRWLVGLISKTDSVNASVLIGGKVETEVVRLSTNASITVPPGKPIRGLFSSVAIDNDGASVVTGSTDGEVMSWIPSAGASLLGRHEGEVSVVALSPDGLVVATASDDRGVIIWGRHDGGRWTFRDHEKVPRALLFSKSGKFLLSRAQNDTHLIDVVRKVGRRLHGAQRLAAFSRDERTVVAAVAGMRIASWPTDIAGGLKLAGSDRAKSVAFSPDGSLVVSSGPGWSMRLWDVRSGEYRDFRGHQSRIIGAEFSPNGALVVSVATDLTLRLWQVATGKSVALPGVAFGPARFSPDGRNLVAIDVEPGLAVWDVATGSRRAVATKREHAVSKFAISHVGNVVASVDLAGTLMTTDLKSATSKVIGTVSGFPHSLVWASENVVLIGTSDGTIEKWDVESGEHSMLVRSHESWVSALAVSPVDGQVISASADGVIILHGTDLESSTILSGHQRTIWDLEISPSGDTLASVDDDGDVRLWNLASGVAQLFSGHRSRVYAVAISKGGNYIASAAGDGIWLWNDDLPRESHALAGWVTEALSANR